MRGIEMDQLVNIGAAAKEPARSDQDDGADIGIFFHLSEALLQFIEHGKVQHVCRKVVQGDPGDMMRDGQQLMRHDISLSRHEPLMSVL